MSHDIVWVSFLIYKAGYIVILRLHIIYYRFVSVNIYNHMSKYNYNRNFIINTYNVVFI